MKFLSWLFNFSMRHRKDAIRYESAGAGKRIIIMILLVCLSGASLALEYWALGIFKENILAGFFAALLALALLITVIEMNSAYCIFGFKSAIGGTLISIIEKNNQKRLAQGKSVDDISSKNEKTKSTKGVDVLVGFVCLILTLGTFVGAILLLVSKVQK